MPANLRPDGDPFEQLRTFGDLREAGILTDAEFDAQEGRAHVLGSDVGQPLGP